MTRPEMPRVALGDVWLLTEAWLVRREAFATACGMVGKSLLDYPGGFRFGPPKGVRQAEVRWFQERSPGYVVWSHTGRTGATYTVAYWSATREVWVFPELVDDASPEAHRHQWLLRALASRPVPEWGPVGS